MRIKVLKRQLAEKPKPPPRIATKRKAARMVAVARSKRAAPGPVAVPGSSMVFPIHDESAKWWRDPSALIFEAALRRTVQQKHPKQSPEAWVVRNKFFKGKRVQWKMHLGSFERVEKDVAGKTYYNTPTVKSQEDRLEKLRSGPVPKDAAGKAARQAELLYEQIALQQMKAERQTWKKLLDREGDEGGTLATVVQQGSGSNSGGEAMVMTVVLGPEDAEKLKEYEEEKREKYGSDYWAGWSVEILGTIQALWLDEDDTLHVQVDGKWQRANEDFEPGNVPKRVAQAQRRTRRDRSSRGRRRSQRRSSRILRNRGARERGIPPVPPELRPRGVRGGPPHP